MLKHKTRIPVEKGYHLHGIMDETGTLEEGQIFCTARDNGVNKVIVGKKLVISRVSAASQFIFSKQLSDSNLSQRRPQHFTPEMSRSLKA